MRDLNSSGSNGLIVDDVYSRERATESTLFLGNHQLGFLESAVATVATEDAFRQRSPAMLSNFRSARGRDLEYSYDLLKRTGIDMASDKPFEAYASFMSQKMDLLDRELVAMGL